MTQLDPIRTPPLIPGGNKPIVQFAPIIVPEPIVQFAPIVVPGPIRQYGLFQFKPKLLPLIHSPVSL